MGHTKFGNIHVHRRGAQSVSARASKALSIARGLKKAIELKALVTLVVDDDPDSATGTLHDLTDVATGDDSTDREGRKILLKSFLVEGNITMSASATTTRVRVTVVQDRLGTTTRPTFAEVWTSAALHSRFQSRLPEIQRRERFRILSDKKFILDAASMRQRSLVIFKKMNVPVYYSGVLATDEGKNHIYLFITSSEVTNVPLLNFSRTVKFTDT